MELSDHDSDEFDASDLLNLDDYQQKRQQKGTVQPPAFIKNVAKPVATAKPIATTKLSAKDDDGWGNMSPTKDGLDEFDYDNSDLNKCSEYELRKHKKKMEENFVKN